MSEERPVGLMIAEKFFGFVFILIGAVTVYITHNDPPGGFVAPFSPIFVVASLLLIAVGVFLLMAKTE